MWNTMIQLVRYFGENKRVNSAEWVEFWLSLTDTERFHYKTVDLSQYK